MVSAETKLETRALWLLPLPQLPSLVLVCTPWEDRSPWKAWGRHPEEKPEWCGWERVYLGFDLGAPHSLLRERKRSGDAGKLRQEEQGSGPV